MARIKVDLGERSYPIEVGSNHPKKLVRNLARVCNSGRLFVFYDSNLYALHGPQLRKTLRAFKPIEFVIPAGERSKSQATLDKLYSFLLEQNISRDDFLLAIGGGVVSDLAGYTAATVLRGVHWGVVPTTLLAMVDAAIGGKTGINHHAGKNLVGAFHQPSFVHVDTEFLHTLPDRELIAGMGEILKYGGLQGPAMVRQISGLGDNSPVAISKIVPLIAQSVTYKADIVSRDEREGSLRMRLNLGHTVGHAIEKTVGYGKLLHGEAVILGLLAMINLSKAVNGRESKNMLDYRKLVEQYITKVPRVRIAAAEVLDAMKSDKKRRSKRMNFVLLKVTGRPFLADKIGMSTMRSAVNQMLRYYQVHGGTNGQYSGR